MSKLNTTNKSQFDNIGKLKSIKHKIEWALLSGGAIGGTGILSGKIYNLYAQFN